MTSLAPVNGPPSVLDVLPQALKPSPAGRWLLPRAKNSPHLASPLTWTLTRTNITALAHLPSTYLLPSTTVPTSFTFLPYRSSFSPALPHWHCREHEQAKYAKSWDPQVLLRSARHLAFKLHRPHPRANHAPTCLDAHTTAQHHTLEHPPPSRSTHTSSTAPHTTTTAYHYLDHCRPPTP